MENETKNNPVDPVEPTQPTQTTQPSTAKKDKKKEEDVVSVPRSLIEEVLAGQKRLEDKLAAKEKEIERLNYAADKSRLNVYDARNNGGQLIRTMNVGVWTEVNEETGESTESVILGWRMVKDEVFVEDNGGVRRIIENQVMRLFLDQGEGKDVREVDINYSNFYPRLKRQSGEVIKETKDEKGEYRTLRLPGGKTVDLNIRFVNP